MANQSFDPFKQQIFLWDPKGTRWNATVRDVDDWHRYSLKSTISFSAQFGACLISLLLMLALTPVAKRRTQIFLLYTFSLTLNMVRLMCRTIYFTSSPVNEFYNYFTINPNPVPASANAIQIVEVIGFLLLLVCVEVILMYQTWILYESVDKTSRWILMGVLAFVGSTAIIIRIIFSVLNIKTILQDTQPPSIAWQKATLAVMIASIGLFTLASCGKLILSWRSRMRMGLRWGPMQWLFWASFESLLIPLTLAIMAPYSDETFPEPEYAVLTAVVVLIPLGSLTATASMYSPRPNKAGGGASTSRGLSGSAYVSGSEALLRAPTTSYSVSTRSASVPQHSPTSQFDRELDKIDHMDTEQPNEDIESGIHVAHGYSVSAHTSVPDKL